MRRWYELEPLFLGKEMSRRPRLRAAVLFALLFLLFVCFSPRQAIAQETTLEDSTSGQAADSSQTSDANEESNTNASSAADSSTSQTTLPSFSYKDTKESFIGRSLILSVGIFPFAYFYSGLAIQMTAYVSSGFDSSYAPSLTSTTLTDSEIWTKLAISSAASLLLGLLSALLK